MNPEEEGKEQGKVEKKRLRKTDSNSSVSSDELLPLRKEGRTGEEKVDVIWNQKEQEREEREEEVTWQRRVESIIEQWSVIDQKVIVKIIYL